jgi:hypothetical protein
MNMLKDTNLGFVLFRYCYSYFWLAELRRRIDDQKLRSSVSRVTRWVCEKIARVFVKTNTWHITLGKSSKKVGYFCNFSKQKTFQQNNRQIGWNSLNLVTLSASRVTRLGEFSPIGQLFSLGSFSNLQKWHKFLGYFFPRHKLGVKFWHIMSWDAFWAIFFKKSSGHPVRASVVRSKGFKKPWKKIFCFFTKHFARL